MLATLVNNLLARFLAPYVEGLEDVQLNFFTGNLEVKSLKLKSTLLSACGLDVAEIEKGVIGRIKIHAPVVAILSGHISFEVSGIDCIVKIVNKADVDAEEVLQKARDGIDERVRAGARLWVEKERRQRALQGSEEPGMAATLIRELIEKLLVNIADVNFGMKVPEADLELKANLPSLTLSQVSPEAKQNKTALAKLACVETLTVRAGSVGAPLEAISLPPLRLVLENNIVSGDLRVDLKTGEKGDGLLVTAKQDQLAQIIAGVMALLKEQQRQFALLQPPGSVDLVALGTDAEIDGTRDEYVALLGKEDTILEMSSTESFRLRMLRDIVPEAMQARWLAIVMQEREAQARLDAAVNGSGCRAGLPIRSGCGVSRADEVEKAFADLSAQAKKLTPATPPSTIDVTTDIAGGLISLVGKEDVQVLSLKIMGTAVSFKMTSSEDEQGEAHMDFACKLAFRGLTGEHMKKHLLSFVAPTHTTPTSKDIPPPSTHTVTDVAEHAALQVEISKVEANDGDDVASVFSVAVVSQPLEVSIAPSLITSLKDFLEPTQKALLTPEAQELGASTLKGGMKQLDNYFKDGQQWLDSEEGKKAMESAHGALPDGLSLQLDLCGPHIMIPREEGGCVRLAVGNLSLHSKGAITSSKGEVQAVLSDIALWMQDEDDQLQEAITPLALEAGVAMVPGDNGSPSQINVDAQIDGLQVKASLEVIHSLMRMQYQFTELLAQQEATEEAAEATSAEMEEARRQAAEYMAQIRDTTRMPSDQMPACNIFFNLLPSKVILMNAARPAIQLDAAVSNLQVLVSNPTEGGGPSVRLPFETDRGKQIVNVGLSIFNQQKGRLEPVLEPAHIAADVTCTLPTSVEVKVQSPAPILLNVTPSAIKFLAYYIPRLVDSFDGSVESTGWISKCRGINLTRDTVTLLAHNALTPGVPATSVVPVEREANHSLPEVKMKPTGSDWRSIDSLLADDVDYIAIHGKDGSKWSHLDARGSFAIRLGSEITDPLAWTLWHVGGMNLGITYQCMLANHTTLPLQIKMSDGKPLPATASIKEELLMSNGDGQRATSAMSAQLSAPASPARAAGTSSAQKSDRKGTGGSSNKEGEVQPECIATVAPTVVGDKPTLQVSLQPSGGTEIEFKESTNLDPEGDLVQASIRSLKCGERNLLAFTQQSHSPPPAEAELILVSILPAIRFVSALPCGLEVQYHAKHTPEDQASTVNLAEFSECSVYDVVTPDDIVVRVRLRPDENWSKPATLKVGSDSTSSMEKRHEHEMDLVCHSKAQIPLLAAVHNHCEVVIYAPTLAIDRTGWGLRMLRHSHPLPADGGVALCGRSDDEHLAEYAFSLGEDYHTAGSKFHLPREVEGFCVAHLKGGTEVCLRLFTNFPASDFHGCPVTCMEVVNRYVVQNSSTRLVEIKKFEHHNAAVTAASEVMHHHGHEVPVQIEPDSKKPLELGGDPLKITIRTQKVGSEEWSDWSQPFVFAEHAAGVCCIMIGREVWSADIRPDNGLLAMQIKEGSNYKVVNLLDEAIVLQVPGCPDEAIVAGQEKDVGWPDAQHLHHRFKLKRTGGFLLNVNADIQKTGPGYEFGDGAEVCCTYDSETTRITACRSGSDTSVPMLNVQVELDLPRVGISVVTESKILGEDSEDLLYLQVDLLRVSSQIQPGEDQQMLDVVIQHLQLDWQTVEDSKYAVVLGSLAGFNTKDGLSPFFELVMERSRTSSPDICFKCLKVKLHPFDLRIDDALIEKLITFGEMATPDENAALAMPGMMTCRDWLHSAGDSYINEYWELPAPSSTVQIDMLWLSELSFHLWLHLKKTLHYLPKWLRRAVQAVSMSDSFTIAGSHVHLKHMHKEKIRNTAAGVGQSIAVGYVADAVVSIMKLLGYSSVLSVPRAPLKLGGELGSSALNAGVACTDSLSKLTERLSMDKAYCQRSEQLRQRHQVTGVKDGFVQAGHDVGAAVIGVFDVVVQPVEGARTGGCKGFCLGIGRGLLGTIFKPIGGLGRAVGHVGAGVAAATTKPHKKEHEMTTCRLPRLLAGPHRAVVDYSTVEAQVVRSLDHEVECAVPLVLLPQARKAREDPNSPLLAQASAAEGSGTLLALVLSTSAVMLAEVKRPETVGAYDLDLEQMMLSKLRVEDNKEIIDNQRSLFGAARPESIASASDGGASRRKLDFRRRADVLTKFQRKKRKSARAEADICGDHMTPWWSGTLPLKSVSWVQRDDLSQAVIEVDAEDGKVMIPIPWGLGPPLAEAIFAALQAGTSEVHGDWVVGLRTLLSQIRTMPENIVPRSPLSAPIPSSISRASLSQHTCECWEVQRLSPGVGWKVPFLHGFDGQYKYRWMSNAMRKRHPYLDLSSDWAQAKEPPIQLGRMWRPDGEWQIIKNEDTDADGWQYGACWSTCSWKPRPSLKRYVRRRCWLRQYTIALT